MTKVLKPDYLGHRKRIKEKYKVGGIREWLDYEVLELALSFAISRKNTKPIAKELLSRINYPAASYGVSNVYPR